MNRERNELKDVDLHVGNEYGNEYQGTYRVRSLAWKEARELIRKAMKGKDPTEYIEELVAVCVTGPVEVSREKLAELPAGLVRRLMDEALRLNDISRQESSFL